MKLPKLKSCGVLVVRGKPIKSFLLMKHDDRWDLPKGHVDPGESELTCALRELEEETGIKPQDIEIDPDFRFTTRYIVRTMRLGGREAEKVVVIFFGRLKRDVEIQPTEHRSFQWFAWSPPHQIQQKTVDPLLAELQSFLTRGIVERPSRS